jgi:uncharacterized protein
MPVFRDSSAWKMGNQGPAAVYSQEGQCCVEPRKYCAYNQTRERFLGVDVDAADFSLAILDDRLPTLTISSGTGLWLIPFRGISPLGVRIPLDLIYLDQNCRVIEAVESFPISRVSPSSQAAASVLVLPAGTVNSTQTQAGDHIVLCVPDEMKRRLQRLSGSEDGDGALQEAEAAGDEANHNGPARVLKFEDHTRQRHPDEAALNEAGTGGIPSGEEHPLTHPPEVAAAPEAESKNSKPKKNWLQRWLNPDPPEPRKAQRASLSGLAAYFWTGGTPKEHGVRDISPSGLFVLTDERWYPGTIVRMTLTDRRERTTDRSITVNASVKRWGNDGVGLQFVLQDGADSMMDGMAQGANKEQVEQFIQLFKNGDND